MNSEKPTKGPQGEDLMPLARCLHCEKTFSIEQVGVSDCCPGCGTKDLPCDPRHDVIININTHELRILGIWAANFAAMSDDKALDNPKHQSLKPVLGTIFRRIHAQLKAKGQDVHLSLEEEMKELEGQGFNPQLFIDGKEQV